MPVTTMTNHRARALAVLLVLSLAACGGAADGPGGSVGDTAAGDAASGADAPAAIDDARATPDAVTDAGRDAARDAVTDAARDAAADRVRGEDGGGDARADAGEPDAGPPRPRICFEPPAVDFGELRSGNDVGVQVAVANCGDAATRLTDVTLSPASSADFRLDPAPPLPADLAVGDEVWIDLRYRPTGGDADHGSIVVAFRDVGDRAAWASLAVHGAEPPTASPALVVEPEVVRFDGVGVGEPVSATVTLRNAGGVALSLTGVALSDDGHPGLSLADVPVPGTLVAPGGARPFTVAFATDEPLPRTTDPIGAVVVRSNDPAAPAWQVPVYATSGAARLVVEPAGTVDFGAVGQGETDTALVTLRNVGGAALELFAVTIEPDDTTYGDEFRIGAPPPLGPPTANGLGSLAAGQSASLPLTFTNNGPANGAAAAALIVESDDGTTPRVTVALVAQRALDPALPPGGVLLDPPELDFGALGVGAAATRTVQVRNRADGPRVLAAAGVAHCDGGGWGWGSACDRETASADFRLETPIPPEGLTIPAGGAVAFDVTFAPAGAPATVDDVLDARGLLWATVADPAVPGAAGRFDLPGGDRDRPNLEGRVGHPLGFAWPPTLSFGDVLVDCTSGAEEVSVIATRSVPLRVFGATIDPACGAPFAVAAPATFPPEGLVATTAAPLALGVTFTPPATGRHTCTLTVATDDARTPAYAVTLSGGGAEDARVEDDFVHRDAPPVDVLFVVDDSGSMCEEQERLAANLDAFVHHAVTWGNDVRIGVVNTCVHDEQVCDGVGRLRSAHPPARWVTNDTWEQFLDNVLIGCWGNSDPQEAGLQAAFHAITPPNATLTEAPCAGDDDCGAPAVCLADLGVCGGANGGFLRADAALEIVVLSDEEDQSDQTTEFYARFFGGFRPIGKGAARVHAIVGDETTGCVGAGTAADPGDRYIAVARATRGVVASICDDSFADSLSAMGEAAFGTRWTYYLTHAADPDSLVVTVAGRPCADGWFFDADDNAVVFAASGPCRPQDGDAINVKYDRVCN